MDQHDLKGIAGAREALRTHHKVMGLEGEPGANPSTDVWHLLLSLRGYCEGAGVDFNATLQNVREEEPYILNRVRA